MPVLFGTASRRSFSQCEVDGSVSYLLAADRDTLLGVDVSRPNVRLLPYFDTYLLGHAERTFVSPERHASVYRKQGWVSSVLLVNGSVSGTWGYEAKGKRLLVRVVPFSGLSRAVTRFVQREAESLALFLGCGEAETVLEAPLA